MQPNSRREFLKQSGLGTAGAVAWACAAPALQAAEANEAPVLAILGCGGRGMAVAAEMCNAGAKFAYVCDVDAKRLAAAQEKLQAPKAVADLRRVLEDRSVDAVLIGMPDHWHSPATILACDAGKHVYVEKPCSHNIREGRLMVEAARRNNRVVQVGTQSRSSASILKAMQLLHEGVIGEVLVAKAWNSQLRRNVGHAEPSDPPAHLDYDAWVGPAPMVPYRASCDHYGWRWNYHFGTGDAGNDGVHELDLARWGLGMDVQPSLVVGYGSKLYFDDDQQFPDTQYATFEYPGDGTFGKKRVIVYEQRIWSPYRQEGMENGNAFYGTEGMMILGKGVSWTVMGRKNKVIAQEPSKVDTTAHVHDFFEAMRSGRKPNGDVAEGHLSASLSHLANIVARTGHGLLHFDPTKEEIRDDAEAATLVRRQYREGHWAAPAGA